MADSLFTNENNQAKKPKKESKLFKPLLAILAVIIILGGASLGGMYWQSNEMQKQRSDSDTRIAAMQKQIDDLKKEETSATTTTTKPAAAKLTNDQIFAEVSSQLGFTRDQLSSFKIHNDKDRVVYRGTETRNAVWGTHYAYKDGTTWKQIPGDSGLSLMTCSDISSVPEKYRTGCVEEGTNQTLYTNAKNEFVNYLPDDMTSYIGQ